MAGGYRALSAYGEKKGGEVLWLCSNDQSPLKGEYEAELLAMRERPGS